MDNEGYHIDVTPDKEDPFKINLTRALRPVAIDEEPPMLMDYISKGKLSFTDLEGATIVKCSQVSDYGYMITLEIDERLYRWWVVL